MIYKGHIPAFPLNQFIEVFVYIERVGHAPTVDPIESAARNAAK